MSKKKLAIVFGGQSAEHTVALMGARTILKAIEDDFETHLLVIDIHGKIRTVDEIPSEEIVEFIDDEPHLPEPELELLNGMDVVFPILHGTHGEDGRIQGFFEVLGISYVGENVQTSAVCMDKDLTKRILEHAGIPVVPWTTLQPGDEIDKENTLYPVFVKPARQGSSIGISKVKREKQFDLAIEEAFNNDRKVMVEKFVPVRELECSVLNGEVSVVGEIIPSHEYYDYEAKYFDEGQSLLQVPAHIPEEVSEKIRSLTAEIAKLLEIQFISRVDFFLDEEGNIYLNEINTMPGFTDFSMYNLLWSASGLSPKDVIHKLIQSALKE